MIQERNNRARFIPDRRPPAIIQARNKFISEERAKGNIPDTSSELNERFTFKTLAKSVVQGMARSFIATGAEISERIMNPMWEPQAKFGEASYTPKSDFERKLFGTSEPISIKSVGEDVLAIGGSEFAERWGAYAIPIGLTMSALDITPMGFAKAGPAMKAAKAISKTDDVVRISKHVSSLFPDASRETIEAISRSFRHVSKTDDVYKSLTGLGSLNVPTSGFSKGSIMFKNPADGYLFGFEDVIRKGMKNIPTEIDELGDAIKKVKIATKSGKIDASQSRLVLSELQEQMVRAGKEYDILFKFDNDFNVKILNKSKNAWVNPKIKKQPIKDIIDTGMLDPTRQIQTMDGAMSAGTRGAPRVTGALEEGIIFRMRDMMKARSGWLGAQQKFLTKMIGNTTKGQRINAAKILKYISSEDVGKSAAKLSKINDIVKITNDVETIKLAVKARKFFDDILDVQNYFRKLRGVKPIKKAEFYNPSNIKKRSIFSRLLGIDATPQELMRSSGFDFSDPKGPFVKHAKKKYNAVADVHREWDLSQLLEGYTNAAGRDIFNTSILDNIWAHARAIEGVAPNSAKTLVNYGNQAFAGGAANIDAALNLSPVVRQGMAWWRNALVRGVFPLNFGWNAFVQTASGVLTMTRNGVASSVGGAKDWFFNPKARAWAEDTYSYMVKTGKSGKVSRQDISNEMLAAVKLNNSKLDKITDVANYFTEATEKHLTGWSILAARRDGLKRGMTGRQLKHWASDGGAKTQSMYNLEDLPGLLRNESVRTIAPFQTYAFEGFNTLREFAGMVGVPPATMTERMKWVLNFTAGASAMNIIASSAIGRKPWQAKSFVPFYDIFAAPVADKLLGDYSSNVGTGRSPTDGIAPISITSEFAEGIHNYFLSGDKKKFMKAAIKYLPGFIGVPAGAQMNKTIFGMKAIADGGELDPSGKMIFPISGTKEELRAMLAGPWATQAGQEKLHEGKKTILPEIQPGKLIEGLFPKKSGKEHAETLQRVRQPYFMRDYLQHKSGYARMFFVDPENALKVLFTRERLGIVEGNLVELERFRGVDYRDEGGSQEYKMKLMYDAGLSWGDKDLYNLEHIVPVKAGGDTSDENLMLVDEHMHNFYTDLDGFVGYSVQSKAITRKEAERLMYKLKVQESITAEELFDSIEKLAKEKSEKDKKFQKEWLDKNKDKMEWALENVEGAIASEGSKN